MAKEAKKAHLDGMEPPSIKEIDEAADSYVSLRDKRMKMLAKEVEAKGELEEIMKKHELKTYTYEDKTVELVPSEKVKVRKVKDADEEE